MSGALKIKKDSFKLNLRNISYVLLLVFTVNAVFLPNDTFEMKILSFFGLLICNIGVIFAIKTKEEKIVFWLGFVLTSVNIVLSTIYTGDAISNIRVGYCGYILLLYLVVKKYNFDFEGLFTKVLVIMAYFMVIMALIDVAELVPMYDNRILMWLHSSSNAMVGKGDHLATGYIIFMKTSPALLLTLPYLLNKKKIFSFAVVSAALMLSGTRANILVAIVVIAFSVVFCQKNRTNRYLSLIIVAAVAVIVLLEGTAWEAIVEMFTRKASGDETRSGHLQSIFAIWRDNPLKFIIGSGYTSTFYSLGTHSYLWNIELSYWNLLRQIGLIPFIFVMAMFVYPIICLFRNKNNGALIMGYIGYLVIAYTNPLLYSSTGLAVLLYMYCLSHRKEIIKDKDI